MFTCVIFVLYLNVFDDLKHLSVTNMQKSNKSGRGQIPFHSTVSGMLIIIQMKGEQCQAILVSFLADPKKLSDPCLKTGVRSEL